MSAGTEAVGCVLETHKNATDFVRAVQKKELAAQPEDDHVSALFWRGHWVEEANKCQRSMGVRGQ